MLKNYVSTGQCSQRKKKFVQKDLPKLKSNEKKQPFADLLQNGQS